MGIDWIELSRAAPYAGVAIIFGLFIVWLLKIAIAWIEKRDTADDAREAAREKIRQAEQARQDQKDSGRDARFIQAIADHDGSWREFMGAERIRQAEGMTLLTRELERVAALVSITNTLVMKHDEWERTLYEAAKARRSGDTGPLGQAKTG